MSTTTKFDEVLAGSIVLITKRGEMPKTANVDRVTKTQIHIHNPFPQGGMQSLIFSRREGDVCHELTRGRFDWDGESSRYLELKRGNSRPSLTVRMYLYSIEMLEQQQERCELEITELAKNNMKKEEQRKVAEMAETKKTHYGYQPIVYANTHEDHTVYVLEIKVKEEEANQKGGWETVIVHVRPNPMLEHDKDGPEIEYALTRVNKASHSFTMTSSDLATDTNEALWEAVNYCYHN